MAEKTKDEERVGRDGADDGRGSRADRQGVARPEPVSRAAICDDDCDCPRRRGDFMARCRSLIAAESVNPPTKGAS